MKQKDLRDLIVVLNSSGSIFKYPMGNLDLTKKVKELETRGLLVFDTIMRQWGTK